LLQFDGVFYGDVGFHDKTQGPRSKEFSNAPSKRIVVAENIDFIANYDFFVFDAENSA